MEWLTDQSVLVTGAGSGLGKALVKRFIAEGASVAAFDKSEAKLDKLRADVGERVVTIVGDVTNFDDNERAVTTVVGSYGKLDVFVGNAGLWDFNGSLADIPPAQLASGFDEIFAVNVKGYLLGVKAAMPALNESKGSVVLTLSNAAFFPAGGGPLYVASKHAGVGLVKQLAYELAPDVRVNAVAPGGMDTDLRGPEAMGMSDKAIGQVVPINEVMQQMSALKRAATAEDYTGAYVLLAARDQSSTVTGAVLDTSSFGTPGRPPR